MNRQTIKKYLEDAKTSKGARKHSLSQLTRFIKLRTRKGDVEMAVENYVKGWYPLSSAIEKIQDALRD